MNGSCLVPQRNFGLSLTDKEGILPKTVSIVGLGCSSFSTFFWTEEQIQNDEQKQPEQFTLETLRKDHPIVQDWIKTIHHAIINHGITVLDTAPWYGHGTSEIVVGWALQGLLSGSGEKMITRESLCINTKIGRYEADPKHQFDFSHVTTIASAQRSLQRLGGKETIQYIDVLQLHDPEFAPTLDILIDETIPALLECRSKGWCKALGLTGYPLEVQYQIFQLTLERYGKESARSIWDQSLTYCHFNLHDSSLVRRSIGKTNGSRTGAFKSFADFCQANNMGLLAAAPLSMGLLTHNTISNWHPALGSKLEEACKKAADICASHNVDIASLAILFALSHPKIPCTILGMKDVEQVDTAISLANRFHAVDWSIEGQSQEFVLQKVLTASELSAYKILSNRETGPFAGLNDRNGESTVPMYQWDGIKEAYKFWERLDCVIHERWQWTSF